MDMRAGIAPSWFQNPEEPPVPPGRKAWQDGGRRTFLGRLGPPAARGPGARSAMLGEGKERRRPGLWLRLGAPPVTRA